MINKKKNSILASFYVLIISISTFIIYQLIESKDIQIQLSKERIIQESKAHINNMIDTRSWNSQYGGVYVKSDNLKPNPYLADNHIYTKDNQMLVKINPAWMSRQISEISNSKRNYKYKITSLSPINPKNEPNAFDKEALEHFIKNKDDSFYYKFSEDLSEFNFMGSLKMKPSCFQCHATKDYEVGDIRGGIRVTMPTTIYQKEILNLEKKTIISLISIVVLTLIVLIIITRLIKSNFKHQEQIETMNMYLEEKVLERTSELRKTAERLEILATTDSLTKVHNRYSIMQLLENEIKRSKRYKHQMCVILYDIDNFKLINDNFGHAVGDDILIKSAQLVKKSLRNIDIIGRYGGEEFLIILPETNSEDAQEITERIRKLIESTNFPQVDKVTISSGVTILSEEDEIESLFKRLDSLLYKAKRTGKNKFYFST